jgi:hypothetical protein
MVARHGSRNGARQDTIVYPSASEARLLWQVLLASFIQLFVMPLADLKVLRDLLLADEAKQRKNDAEVAALGPSLQEADAKIRTALEAFGVLPPSGLGEQRGGESQRQPRWKRSLNSSLITVPSVPSQTTLVPLSSIPHPNRAKLRFDASSLDEDALVEVPVAVLMPPEDGAESAPGGGTSSALSRPLQGNLSSKLSEFTRGQVGRRRPFKAGGIDSDDLAIPSAAGGEDEEEEVTPAEFLSPEECKAALDALDKGPLEAWRDGSLITAPPGVTFKVGLGPKDVYSEEEAAKFGEKGCAKEEAVEASGDTYQANDGVGDAVLAAAGGDVIASGISTNKGPSLLVSTDGMWDKTYFDDDSLFADSSSDGGSDEECSDEDEEASDDSSMEEEMANEVEDVAPDQKQNASTATKQVNDVSMEEGEAAVEDIDGLLEELVFSTQSDADKVFSKETKKKKDFHPLLANSDGTQRGGDLTSSSSSGPRKSWAVTDLLPIKDFNALVPNPAIRYPFELDDFQKQAVARLERSECIFVAAHTSAGKTVCAEYAIALARKHCTRAIYTSPIKALSNQKYRDFKDNFGEDVGLITGDLQIGADSSCLIMTTEILRSMLYRGADLIRDIEWVIFDEVHYINDTERGVVWEEVIIMLPQYVNMIFLSATTPNTIEFSDWIGRTKRKPVHVIRTDYRPVPLSHHLWAGQQLHKIMEGKSGFLDKGYSDAAKDLLPASVTAQSKDKKGGTGSAKAKPQGAVSHRLSRGSKDSSWQQQGNKGNWQSLIKFLDREGLTPTVIFSFSKKKCEEIANMLRTLDLNTAVERNAAHMFAMQTMARLSPNDASLPQVLQTCEMVKRGIGVVSSYNHLAYSMYLDFLTPHRE